MEKKLPPLLLTAYGEPERGDAPPLFGTISRPPSPPVSALRVQPEYAVSNSPLVIKVAFAIVATSNRPTAIAMRYPPRRLLGQSRGRRAETLTLLLCISKPDY
jgi:hypothetical protein